MNESVTLNSFNDSMTTMGSLLTCYTEEGHVYCMTMWASDLMEPDRFLRPVVGEELSLSVT